MRFNTTLDAQTFLMEIKNFDKLSKADNNYAPTNEEIQSFLKARTPLVKKLKDYRRSSSQKANWRKNRYKMLKGIKAFHKSVQGKRFHRKLGRFLATRIFRTKTSESGFDMLLSKQAYLKGLNSARQHLIVELEYFHQLQEQVELEEFITNYGYPYLRAIEEKIMNDEDLVEDEVIFLMDLIEENALITSFAEKTGKTFAETEKMWNTIASNLEKQRIDRDDDRFFPFLISRLKKNVRD